MRSQNIKRNSIGKVGSVSCLLLLLLAFLAVNPIVSSSAFADGVGEDNDEFSEETADDLIETYADTSSTVGISFSPARYYAELAPTNSTGQSARIDLSTTIYVYNSGGYTVYLKSDSPNLVGEKNSSNFIPGASTAKTYANMDVNTWGYAWADKTTSVPNTATYKAVAASGNGDKLAENTSDDIEVETRTIALSFATKINDQKAADTYSNTMTLSVVSSPMKVTFTKQGITTMQEMTADICAAAPTGDSKQLKDTRDNKFYWVSKLADGKCWMTQNLDLDLSTGTALSSATSDLGWTGTAYPATAKTWTPGYTTATTATADTILADNTGQRSWSLGNYRITNPDTSSDCGYPKNSAANCTSQFTAATTPTSANNDANAHYILGNHYQWNAATAGTGGTITSGQATDSICPRNWRLPTSTSTGEFAALVTALGGTSTTNNVTKSPFYGVRGGFVNQTTSYLFIYAGNYGYYWSSTPDSSGSGAYNLRFNGTNYVNPSSNSNRYGGSSVRCVAR